MDLQITALLVEVITLLGVLKAYRVRVSIVVIDVVRCLRNRIAYLSCYLCRLENCDGEDKTSQKRFGSVYHLWKK
jgi:hypothetical protein